MAKRTKTITTEEIEESPEKDLNYLEDVHEGKLTAVKEPQEEQISEEKPKEEVKEETVETPTPVVEEIEFDPKQFQEETANQITDKIVSALKGDTKQETQENIHDLEKFRRDFEKKNGRDPNWIELGEYVGEAAYTRIKTEQQAEYARYQAENKALVDEETSKAKAFESQFTEEISELYAHNKMPKIKNPQDRNDPGVLAYVELENTMVRVNTQRVSEGKEPIRSIAAIHNLYYKSPTRQPAGGDISVGGSRSTASNDDNEVMDYRQIHGKKWTDLFKR